MDIWIVKYEAFLHNGKRISEPNGVSLIFSFNSTNLKIRLFSEETKRKLLIHMDKYLGALYGKTQDHSKGNETIKAD
jgi:hypothetical protein